MRFDSKKGVAPIAVVGMAFRFPGDLSDERSFWQALREGRDLVGRIGEDRWAGSVYEHPKRGEPGRSVTFSAGVLSRIGEFDAGFFGISPREAAWLDPQQRLLLELAWEAMENGGVVPSAIAGSDCAVYVGISGVDYGMRVMDDLSSMTSHSMTGNTLSIAANRLSYIFDLHGPSVAVDTACSSSLVALHHACNSLLTGEAPLAMVGGVNLLLHPYSFVGFTKASMLSANGRCRAFDASGDGYVRAEGGAVLLLKPLDKALAEGNEIHAVILASGVNSDGGRKTGITIPSNEGQADLMRAVLGRSGLAAGQVDYIEAHGTGTPVGDPVETAAIGKVYGHGRSRENPLPIGSVKTNLGHLETASGMAGLIKAILVLKNRALPASLHLENPNPHIDFAGLNLDVVRSYRRLSRSGRKKFVVGVNSFGFGGANAHVLLQEFRSGSRARPASKVLPVPPLFLSARSVPALRELAGRYAEVVRRAPEECYDLAYAAAYHRQRLERRLALAAGTPDELADGLARFAQGEAVQGLVLEEGATEGGKLAFVYSGNGAQWLGMGQRLLAGSPRFAEIIAGLDASVARLAGFSITDELRADEASSRLDDTVVAQPLLFAIQVALTMMMGEQGIRPAAVAGHSVGEVAAAWAAGALDLETALEVIVARSAAQGLTAGTGRMAAVGLAEDEARELLAAEGLAGVDVAGINSPTSVTLSGDPVGLGRLAGILASRGIFHRQLGLNYAFHSPCMDPIRPVLAERLGRISPRTTQDCTFVSTVTGDVVDGTLLDADYWWRNVRQPVRFVNAMASLARLGCRVFVELGPHAILQRYMRESLAAHGTNGRVMNSLRRDDDGPDRLGTTILGLHLLAEPFRPDGFFPEPGRAVRLPNYPWQRERYWHPRTSEGYGLIDRARVHPLLGWRLKDAAAGWENVVDPIIEPWLGDHRVGGSVVLPGAAYVEMAFAAAREWLGGSQFELEDLDIVAPIVFDGEHARSLRFELVPRDGSFQIRSRQRLTDDDWTLNAVGRILGAPSVRPEDISVPEPAAATSVIDPEVHYRLAGMLGLDYGPTFRGLAVARIHGRILHADLMVPDAVRESLPHYLIHAALLDVCFQSVLDFFQAEIESGHGVCFLPVKFGHLRYYGGGPVAGLRTIFRRRSARSVVADFDLVDAEGRVVAVLSECRFRAAALQRAQAEPAAWRIMPQLMPLAVEQAQLALPSTRELVKRLTGWFVDEEENLQRGGYFKGALPLFEALTVSFGHKALADLFARKGDWLQQVLSHPEFLDAAVRPFLIWLARILEREDLLVKDAGVWRLADSNLPPAEDIWRTLLSDHPACLPEVVVAGRVGIHLAEWLAGEVDRTALVEDLSCSHQMQALFEDAPAYLGTRLAVRQVLRIVAASRPSGRRLRVLEIASGSSDLATSLGDLLPPDGFELVLARAEDGVLAALGTEHAGSASVQVAKIEDDSLKISGEGQLPEVFDIVIMRHWLHRSARPVAAISAARHKLALGGLLFIAERHPDLAADFLSGLDAGMWRESPEGAPESRLLPPQAWEHALAEQGFVQVESFREPASDDLPEGSYVVLAKRSEQDRVASEQPAPASWLLLCDAAGVSGALADRLLRLLESQGQYAIKVPAGTSPGDDGSHRFDPAVAASYADMLFAARGALGGLDHVVYLTGLANGPDIPDTPVFPGEFDRCSGLLHLVQALETGDAARPRLWVVTAGGALATGGPAANPVQAALWGFGRVLMNEHPGYRCTLIDLDLDPAGNEAALRLQNELLQSDGESEVVLTAQGRHCLRIVRAAPPVPCATDTSGSRYRLDFRAPGHLRNLVWLPQQESELAEDEIEVRVNAAGLNFRDIMYVIGLLPDEAVERGFAGASLGLEFSGVVTRVGDRPGEFSVGDAVMGFGSGCFASHVRTRANAVVHKPADWSFEAAATVPTVFFTVYYALRHLADVQAGDRVLVHGAAGGVGIAAIQLALQLGAEVFATAGSEEKRDFVRLLGADHVFDSRSLAFADQIMAITEGAGVDVILNSLAGEAIRRNLRVLKPFGRFLELGKRDFYENTPIGLRPFKDNISYFGIDADQLLISRPALAARLFREVMALFRDGSFAPLPYRAFPADRVVDAFRTMQQSRHIGKVVVRIDQARIRMEQALVRPVPVQLRKDATYLVTGGVSGFGLESARWLAMRGAGHLVLVSRRGLRTPQAGEAVSGLEALGARVKVVSCDIADRQAVDAMLAGVRRDMPPLAGVLHAAMVLDDALIVNLDTERMRKVLAPKVLGAYNLHSLTLDIPLDHFILYSSVTSFMGNPGQGNYVAANGYLEGLASLRQAMGLPATCIAWGAIGDAGYLTRNEALRESLGARFGAAPLPAAGALLALDALMAGDPGAVSVGDFDWNALARLLPSAQGPRFSIVRRQAAAVSDAEGGDGNFRALIDGKTPEEIRVLVRTLVTQEVAQILSIGADRIDPARSLHELGMDSLMGIELALGLEERFAIQFPAMMLNEGPTVDRVTARIVERILGTDDATPVEPRERLDSLVSAMAAQHGEAIPGEEMAETVAQVERRVRTGTRLLP